MEAARLHPSRFLAGSSRIQLHGTYSSRPRAFVRPRCCLRHFYSIVVRRLHVVVLAPFFLELDSRTSVRAGLAGMSATAESTGTQGRTPRVLLIGLEFVDPLFSGNGIYSRSIVRSLIFTAGYDVHVLCGRPKADAEKPIDVSSHDLATAVADGRLTFSVCPLPVWRKLDADSSWTEFGDLSKGHVTDILHKFRPTVVFGVDWTSAVAFQAMNMGNVPFYYFVFRSFSAEQGLPAAKKEWYTDKEQSAAKVAAGCVVLSQVDRKWNVDSYVTDTPLRVHVLNPPIREDFYDLYFSSHVTRDCPWSHRRHITCCSRLEPSKRVDLFVDMMVHCAGYLKERGYVPLLIGSRTDAGYSDRIVRQLQAAYPEEGACVIMDFVKDPQQLMAMWESTVLNVHPALYESYGMTICEAALFGVPTLLDQGTFSLPPHLFVFSPSMTDPPLPPPLFPSCNRRKHRCHGLVPRCDVKI